MSNANEQGVNTQSAKLVCATDIPIKPIKWLWPGFIAQGKITMLGGVPGTGKTTIATALAATASTGGKWADGELSGEPGNILIWSGEDSPEDTIIPRLKAMDADLGNIHFVSGVEDNGQTRAFDPARDITLLNESAEKISNIRLLIIDPIVSAISGDSHKNAEVRRALQPISDFAEKHKIAVIGITHLSKGTAGKDPLERLTGSIAFGAVARIVLIAAKLKDEESGAEYHALVRVKSNISADGGGFRYGLEHPLLDNGISGSKVIWGEALEGTAREIMQTDCDLATNEELSSLDEAKQFLLEELANGEVKAKQVRNDAEGIGIAWTTLKRAKSALKIEVKKLGMKDGWIWQLPAEGAQER